MKKKWTLNLDTKIEKIQKIRGLKQDDTEDFLYIRLIENSLEFKIEDNYNVRVNFCRQDGKVLCYVIEKDNIKDNIITIKINKEILKVAGEVKADITIYNSDMKQITTATFTLQVSKAIIATGNVVDKKDMDVIQKIYFDENERKENEKTRITNEDIRKTNELERIKNEKERISSEDIRIKNEKNRERNELERKENEDIRKTNELERIKNEKERISSEDIRIKNEKNREQEWNKIKDKFNKDTKISWEDIKDNEGNTLEKFKEVVTSQLEDLMKNVSSKVTYNTIKNGDFNKITEPGIYSMYADDTLTIKNAPESLKGNTYGGAYTLIVGNSFKNKNFIEQIVIQSSTGDTFIRTYTGMSNNHVFRWTEWRKILFDNECVAFDNLGTLFVFYVDEENGNDKLTTKFPCNMQTFKTLDAAFMHIGKVSRLYNTNITLNLKSDCHFKDSSFAFYRLNLTINGHGHKLICDNKNANLCFYDTSISFSHITFECSQLGLYNCSGKFSNVYLKKTSDEFAALYTSRSNLIFNNFTSEVSNSVYNLCFSEGTIVVMGTENKIIKGNPALSCEESIVFINKAISYEGCALETMKTNGGKIYD